MLLTSEQNNHDNHKDSGEVRIQVKLMGMLKDRTPDGGHVELDQPAQIQDVLRALGIESESIQVFSVNGSIERDKSRQLTDGDELTVLPPVGGG